MDILNQIQRNSEANPKPIQKQTIVNTKQIQNISEARLKLTLIQFKASPTK